MSVAVQDPKRQIRDWWRSQIEGKEEIDLDELTAAALDELTRDESFRDMLMATVLRDIVREQGKKILQQTLLVQSRDGRRYMSPRKEREEVEEEVTAVQGTWAIFRDHDATGKVVNLMEMSYEQLIGSALRHYDNGVRDLRRAGLYKLLAEQMVPGQVVAERFSRKDIEGMWDRLEIKFGYRVKPEAIAEGSAA